MVQSKWRVFKSSNRTLVDWGSQGIRVIQYYINFFSEIQTQEERLEALTKEEERMNKKLGYDV